ncbi:hypothetical protein T4D_7873 [Trichinella pseudospiralis]|uniref:Uncharacterized protein n=1 Tax=Trichinella pseudospiralis TaxID=6337 RepID=A0A0V1FFJ7_TRIPS|nr:hypothetical protein T4D_7873 [Trichinella pseudospiralis]
MKIFTEEEAKRYEDFERLIKETTSSISCLIFRVCLKNTLTFNGDNGEYSEKNSIKSRIKRRKAKAHWKQAKDGKRNSPDFEDSEKALKEKASLMSRGSKECELTVDRQINDVSANSFMKYWPKLPLRLSKSFQKKTQSESPLETGKEWEEKRAIQVLVQRKDPKEERYIVP